MHISSQKVKIHLFEWHDHPSQMFNMDKCRKVLYEIPEQSIILFKCFPKNNSERNPSQEEWLEIAYIIMVVKFKPL